MTVLEPVIEYLASIYEMQGARRVVSLKKIMEGSDRPRKPVLRVLDKLTREGYLVQVADKKIPNGRREFGPARRNPEWRIVKDLFDRDPVKPRKNNLRDRLWKLIRLKRRFTRVELGCLSGAKPSTVDEYVRLLEKAGYLRRTGKDGRFVVFMLVKDHRQRPTGLEKGGKS